MFFEDSRSIISSMTTDTVKAKKEILIAMSRTPAAYGWKEYLKEYKEALDRGVLFKFLVHSTNYFLNKVIEVNEVEKYLRNEQIKLRDIRILYQPFVVIDGKNNLYLPY